MSHFAKLDENNLVVYVTVGRQEDDGKEAELYVRTGDVYKQTSYNTRRNQHTQGGTPLRGNYAGIGYTYDQANDVFYAPKPYASWTLNESTWTWDAPTSMPTDDKRYKWNESTTSWNEITFD